MNDSERRRDSLHEVRTALLDSARDDGPSRKALPRTLATLGLGTAAGLGAGSTAAAGAAAKGIVWKWLVIGAVAGVTGLGVYTAYNPTPDTKHASPVQLRENAPPAPSPRLAESSPGAKEIDPPSDTNEEPASPSITDPGRRARPTSADSRKQPPSLADEVGMLDEARRALAEGNSAKGLDALDRYSKACPSAQLSHEATVLRIEGLMAQGDCARAIGLGQTFLQKNPSSSVARRVRTLLKRKCPPSELSTPKQ